MIVLIEMISPNTAAAYLIVIDYLNLKLMSLSKPSLEDICIFSLNIWVVIFLFASLKFLTSLIIDLLTILLNTTPIAAMTNNN